MAQIKQEATDEVKVLEMCRAHGLSAEDVRTVAAYPGATKISDMPVASRKRPCDDYQPGSVVSPEVRAAWVQWHDQDPNCQFKFAHQPSWEAFLQHMYYLHGFADQAKSAWLTNSQEEEWKAWHAGIGCDFRTNNWDLFMLHLNFDHPNQLPPPVLPSAARDLNSNKF